MPQKTYLSHEQQWDRSVQLIQARRRLLIDTHRLGVDLTLGRVVESHRLFRRGDLVFISLTSFNRERCCISAVSSKGYSVSRFFTRLFRGDSVQKRCRGMIQAVELPDHLTNKRPDDPAVRQYAVGPLRAEDAANSGRRE